MPRRSKFDIHDIKVTLFILDREMLKAKKSWENIWNVLEFLLSLHPQI